MQTKHIGNLIDIEIRKAERSRSFVATKIGMTPRRFSRKVSSGKFTVAEAASAAHALGLTDEHFARMVHIAAKAAA